MANKKKRKLKNLKVEYVSYVDRGANQRTFYLTKEFEENKNAPNFTAHVRLICSEKEEERKVYGLVYAPDTVDAHGDYTDARTLEKAAHDFMLNFQKMDVQHNMEDGAGQIVESFIAPETFVVNSEEIIKGSWVIVSLASEEVWEKIKKGEITGYSLYGTAEMEYEKVSILDLLGNLFKKEKVDINNMEVVMDEELKKAIEQFNEAFNKIASLEEKVSVISEGITSIKSMSEDVASVKKFIEDINVDELKKSFIEMDTKMDGIIENIATSTVSKSKNDNDSDNDVEIKRTRIL